MKMLIIKEANFYKNRYCETTFICGTITMDQLNHSFKYQQINSSVLSNLSYKCMSSTIQVLEHLNIAYWRKNKNVYPTKI